MPPQTGKLESNNGTRTCQKKLGGCAARDSAMAATISGIAAVGFFVTPADENRFEA